MSVFTRISDRGLEGATSTDTARLKVISQEKITFKASAATRAQLIARDDINFYKGTTLFGGARSKGDITFDGQTSVVAINDLPIVESNKTLKVDEAGAVVPLAIQLPKDFDGDALFIRVTDVPDSGQGAIRLADGSSVNVGQVLTMAELQSLTFVSESGAVDETARFSYAVDDGWCVPVMQTIEFQFNSGGEGPTPPELTLTAQPGYLWPPNHKLVEVDVAIQVDTDADITVKLESITANEPVNGKGDGNTDYDYEVTTDGRIFLRAERSGGDDGRIYTLTYSATDRDGNVAYSTVDVAVAHDQGGGTDDQSDKDAGDSDSQKKGKKGAGKKNERK